jgi:hypothetical protein
VTLSRSSTLPDGSLAGYAIYKLKRGALYGGAGAVLRTVYCAIALRVSEPAELPPRANLAPAHCLRQKSWAPEPHKSADSGRSPAHWKSALPAPQAEFQRALRQLDFSAVVKRAEQCSIASKREDTVSGTESVDIDVVGLNT